MAKFRQGDLVLLASQKITQGSRDVLTPDGTAVLAALQFESGALISQFDTDVDLTADSDARVATQAAIKGYVDGKIGGAITSGTDQSIARYSGTDVIEDSPVYINDQAVVSGVETVMFNDSTAGVLLSDSTGIAYLSVGDADTLELHYPGEETAKVAISEYGLAVASDGFFGDISAINTAADELAIANLTSDSTSIMSLRCGVSTPSVDYQTIFMGGYGIATKLYSNDVLVGDFGDTIQTIGVSGGTGIGLNQTADVISLSANNTAVASLSSTAQSIGVSGDTIIALDQSGDEITLTANNAEVGSFTDDIQTIGGTRAGGSSPHMTIQVDNSNSEDVQVSMGSGNNYYLINDTSGVAPSTHTMVDSGSTVFQANASTQRLGISGDTNVYVDQAGTIDLYANNVQAANFASTSQRLGVSGDTNIALDQSTDEITVTANGTEVGSYTNILQIIGDPTDTRIQVSQTGNRVTIYGGNTILAIFDLETGVDLYHGGAVVSQTTANGITGAVWG